MLQIGTDCEQSGPTGLVKKIGECSRWFFMCSTVTGHKIFVMTELTLIKKILTYEIFLLYYTFRLTKPK